MTRGLNHCAALTGAAELGYQRGANEFSTLSLQLQTIPSSCARCGQMGQCDGTMLK